jgi:sulfonate transport system substrate-binding protein
MARRGSWLIRLVHASWALLALALVAGCRSRAARPDSNAVGTSVRSSVRIAYQRSSWSFLVLRGRHTLEDAFGPSVEVRWIEMPSGAPVMEAINLGGADLGAVGDTPAVFAQASGYAFEYVALEPAKPDAIAIVVAKGSERRSLADLKGASVALQKGSTAQHLLVRALATVGLTPSDVREVFLSPPDALAAFGSGRVDAWAVWDPYYAQAEVSLGARALATARGLLPYYTFYVSRPAFARDHRAELNAILQAIGEVDRSLDTDPAGTAVALAAETGVDAHVLERALGRMHFGVAPMTSDVRASQDALSSLFASLHLLPEPHRVPTP